MEKAIKHLKRSTIAEAVGWIGSLGILSSYLLLSIGIISGNSASYYILSGLGALGLAVVTYRHRAFQSFVVNIIFTILAAIALVRIVFFS